MDRIICKYSSHSENDDGSCIVAFTKPDLQKYYVYMPKKWKYNVLGWIQAEGIEIFLSKKFKHDKLYDKINNIQRRLKININGITFCFDSFDGHIEIYNALVGYYNFQCLDSLTSTFDLSHPKFINQFSEHLKKSDNNIEVKTIKVVKQRDYLLEDNEVFEINGSWEEFIRDEKIKELIAI